MNRARTGLLLAAIALPLLSVLVGPAPGGYAASATTTTLTIQKGGDRTGGQTVAGLGGAVFDFFAGTAGTVPAANAVPTASCTTVVGTGRCSVDVPGQTGGTGSSLRGYWIRERTAPAGFSIATTLDVGPGSSTVPTPYNQLFTGNVANNASFTFPVAQTGNSDFTARGPTWADIRNDPDLPDHCGLKIAFLIDTSGSVAPFLTMLKDAADGFVDALAGTPSQIALFRFATTASQLTGSISTATAATAAPLKTAIGTLTAAGSTNWDQGLALVAAAPTAFDAVLMLTDGNPTVYGPNADGPGSNTRFREVENGIFSANAVKAEGSKIVAVGVGAGVTGATDNLKAISGPIAGTDFVQTGFAQLGDLLRGIALKTCAGTVSVVKQVIPFGGTIAQAVPAAGWTFTGGGNTTPASAVTGVTGVVNFTVALGGLPTVPVTLTETQKPGFTLVQTGGENAACTVDGQPVAVTSVGTTGFTVSAEAAGIVSCVVYNMAPQPTTSMVVNKTWVINGTTFANLSQPGAFQSTLNLSGQTTAAFGHVFTGLPVGLSVTIGETLNLAILPPGCTIVASGDIGDRVLAATPNVFMITNTVTCTTTLTLFKNVANPFGAPAPANAWTLHAFPPTGPAVITGTSGVSGPVLPAVRYALGESTVAGYAQEVVANAVIVPPATGSWHCFLRQRDGLLGPQFDGLNGGVTVQLGQHAECTANNTAQPAKLTLTKLVTNRFGGTAKPADWLLHADPPATTDTTPPAVPVVGRSGQPVVTGAEMVPGVAYTLTESDGPAVFAESGDPTCVVTGSTTSVPLVDGAVIADIGQDITCTFTNAQLRPPPPPPPPPAPQLPTTGVRSGLVAGWGLLFLLGGAALTIGSRRRPSKAVRST